MIIEWKPKPKLSGIRTVNVPWGRQEMTGIFLGISGHKVVIWAVGGLTIFSGLIAAITADSAMGMIAMVGGIALGMMLLREKVRDYRVENWRKQAEDLDKQLNEERIDHERTRDRLRALLAQEIRHPTP